jgi:pimeloyl-ACP methyl ester carboxylesterase
MVCIALLFSIGTRATSGYETRYFNQTLDHETGEGTWSHRYLYSDVNWNGSGILKNKCKGPILLYTGNEGPITSFWASNGFMIDVLAPKWGALLVFPEERYYGESLPFGKDSFSAEHVKYLTVENILADYVALVKFLKRDLGDDATNCPVIAFGGSFGGTLTTFIRAAYPDVITGGLAASAPIGYYDVEGWTAHNVDTYTWSNIVARDYDEGHPLCIEAITATMQAIARATDAKALTDAFHLCDVSGLGPDATTEFFAYALEGLPQQNYPYRIGDMPAWPVNATCQLLTSPFADKKRPTDEELIAAAARVTDMAFGYSTSNGPCISTFVEGPGGVPGDGPGPDAWGWQSCTENLHQFSSKSAVRTYTFSLSGIQKTCDDLFNRTALLTPNKLTNLYGGYKLGDGETNVSKLIWSNGRLDPWHGGGFLEPGAASTGNHWIWMKNGAHHVDLRAPHPEDPEDITAARAMEESIIKGWIDEAGCV